MDLALLAELLQLLERRRTHPGLVADGLVSDDHDRPGRVAEVRTPESTGGKSLAGAVQGDAAADLANGIAAETLAGHVVAGPASAGDVVVLLALGAAVVVQEQRCRDDHLLGPLVEGAGKAGIDFVGQGHADISHLKGMAPVVEGLVAARLVSGVVAGENFAIGVHGLDEPHLVVQPLIGIEHVIHSFCKRSGTQQRPPGPGAAGDWQNDFPYRGPKFTASSLSEDRNRKSLMRANLRVSLLCVLLRCRRKRCTCTLTKRSCQLKIRAKTDPLLAISRYKPDGGVPRKPCAARTNLPFAGLA